MVLYFENKKPFVEGINLNEILSRVETPFYIYSQKKITESYFKLKNKINAEIFYAVKANSNQAIISLLNSLGAGADVVSSGEIERAIRSGVSPKKIIFEGVGKSENDIKIAVQNNIKQINIESLEEFKIINKIGESLNQKIKIGIRINPDVDAETLDKISTGRKTDKFGIPFDMLSIVCQEIKKSKFVILKGISCHIGSQIHDIDIFKKTFKKIKDAIEILKNNDFHINSLDLGGGFGVTYGNEKELDLDKISELINKIFGENNYDISIEPGRFLVANAGILVTKILNSKKNDSVEFLITDAGMQTLIRPAMYNSTHTVVPFSQENEKKKYTIAGPICESSDILAHNVELPEQKAGNYLALCDVGAYGFVMASNYNSKILPTEILINDNKFEIIRKQENISDLIDKDIIPSWLKN